MLDIYIAKLPTDYSEEAVYPPERQKIIENTKNKDVRRERYFVWRLLERAVMQSLGKTLEDISPYINNNGKWLSDKCYFSLSHTDCAVAVAVSDSPVGIDIEAYRKIDIDAFGERILSSNERAELENESDKNGFIIELWTKKESIYKMNGTPPFVPSKIETKDYQTLTYHEWINDKKCCVSVCSSSISDAKITKIIL